MTREIQFSFFDKGKREGSVNLYAEENETEIFFTCSKSLILEVPLTEVKKKLAYASRGKNHYNYFVTKKYYDTLKCTNKHSRNFIYE